MSLEPAVIDAVAGYFNSNSQWVNDTCVPPKLSNGLRCHYSAAHVFRATADVFRFYDPVRRDSEERISNVIIRVSRTNRMACFMQSVFRRKPNKNRKRAVRKIRFFDENGSNTFAPLVSSTQTEKMSISYFSTHLSNTFFIFSHRHILGVSPTTPLKFNPKTYATKRFL